MKTLKNFILVMTCFCILIFCGGFAAVYAGTEIPTLLYDGKDKTLTVFNTEGTDLFPAFKDVMPGDVCSQKIMLKTRNVENKTAIWLKAESDIETAKALEGLTINVYTDGNPVFSGPAAGSSSMNNGVELYEFTEDKDVSMQIELNVPHDAGNEFAGISEHLRWIFIVQDEEGSEAVSPKTGDDYNIAIYFASAGIAIIVIAAVLFRKKHA